MMSLRSVAPFIFTFLLTCLLNGLSAQPEPPENLSAVAYDHHIEIRWNRTLDPDIATYRLYRANAQGEFELLKILSVSDTLYLDWLGAHEMEHRYTVTTRSTFGIESDTALSVSAQTFEMSDEQFMDMVQEYTFRYFWDFAHPVSGLTRERNTSGETVTMGGSGFGIMAILVGIERGFISYNEGLSRILKSVVFLESADRFYGAFPHWMNGTTGDVIPFSSLDNGGDIVETAFLFQGLLTAREYFDGTTSNEIVLRQKITDLWRQVNWNWYRNNRNVILWHWSPQHQFAINHEIRGWNEALIVYLLAVASPTHPVPASVYHTGWAGGNYTNGFSIYGYTLPVGSLTGGPLFFAHYSFLGFDPRFYRDEYANYYIQNRNHTLIHRAYCADNPENHVGYSDVCWGLTASDDPLVGYLAHEATFARDNGTIAPTAAVSSMPYTPMESLEAMKHFYRAHGEQLWGPMGFYDAFNLTENWYASSYLAIDQGPIIGMIENHRTRLLWDHFMKNPEITAALEEIGFERDSTSVGLHDLQIPADRVLLYPNPASHEIFLHNLWSRDLTIEITNAFGEVVGRPGILQSGNTEKISVPDLPAGVYFIHLHDPNGLSRTMKFVVAP